MALTKRRAEPRLDVLEILCNIFKLSLDDLLLKDLTTAKGPQSYLEKRRQMKMVAEIQVIHFVPVKAAAGYLPVMPTLILSMS